MLDPLYLSVLTAQKNRLIEIVLLIPTTYVFGDK